MALYTKDFSTETGGVAISGWTERWSSGEITFTAVADSAVIGGLFGRMTVSGGSNRRGLSWNAVDGDADRDDVDVVVRFRLSSDQDQILRVVARGSGNAGSETSYHINLPRGNGTQYDVAKYVNGASSTLGSVQTDFQSNTWYYARLRVRGSSVQAKIWEDGENGEPDGWGVDVTDTDVTGVGWCGLGSYDDNYNRDIDYIAVGTGTTDAPTYSSASDAVRLTQQSAEVLDGLTAADKVRLTQYSAEVLDQLVVPNAVRLTQHSVEVLAAFSAGGGGGGYVVVNLNT